MGTAITLLGRTIYHQDVVSMELVSLHYHHKGLFECIHFVLAENAEYFLVVVQLRALSVSVTSKYGR